MPKRGCRNHKGVTVVRRTRGRRESDFARPNDNSLGRVAAILSILGTLIGFTDLQNFLHSDPAPQYQDMVAASAATRDSRAAVTRPQAQQQYRAEFGYFDTEADAKNGFRRWQRFYPAAFNASRFYVHRTHTTLGTPVYVVHSTAMPEYYKVQDVCRRIQNTGINCYTTPAN